MRDTRGPQVPEHHLLGLGSDLIGLLGRLALTEHAGLVLLGLLLFGQSLLLRVLRLVLVDVLHQDALVLVHVTLGLHVEPVVPGGGDGLLDRNSFGLDNCK